MTQKVIEQVLTLMCMMAVGYLLRKKKIINDTVSRGLGEILMNVTLPFMIIHSFNFRFSPKLMDNAWTILLWSFIIHGLMIVFCRLWYCKFKGANRHIFLFSTVFTNCAFIGYPLTQGIFGDIGVFYTSMYTIPFNIFAFTYGIMLFTDKPDVTTILRNLVNMPLIATVLGMVVFVFSLKLPLPVSEALSGIGNMTTPLSMLIIGAMLADVKIRDVFKGLDVYYLSFIKLIIAPMIAFFMLRPLIQDKILVELLVIMVAMPTATLVGVFAEKYNNNRHTASRCAFITTALSMITVPVIVSMM